MQESDDDHNNKSCLSLLKFVLYMDHSRVLITTTRSSGEEISITKQVKGC